MPHTCLADGLHTYSLKSAFVVVRFKDHMNGQCQLWQWSKSTDLELVALAVVTYHIHSHI